MKDPIFKNPKTAGTSLKRILAAALLLSMAVDISACKKKKKAKDNGAFASGSYNCVSLSVPQKEDYDEHHFVSMIPDGDNTCVCVELVKYDKENDYAVLDMHTEIYAMDKETGNAVKTLTVGEDERLCAATDDYYIFLFGREVIFRSKDSFETVKTISLDFDAYSLVPISDGFVVAGTKTLSRFDKDGNLLKSMETGFPLYIDADSFFEDNGRFYAIEEEDMGRYVYHEVDFETGKCPALARSGDIGISGSPQGKFFFNPNGEYRVDLANMRVELLADYNCIDICPPKYDLSTPAGYLKIDDDRFAVTYEYRDNTTEVLLCSYDPSIDRSDMTPIKIGGFGIFNDEILKWVVYEFNTSQDEYRVVLEEYGDRFEGLTPDDRRKATLNLTQYFNEGNAPDIYYGTRFDYAYMGRNGMVIDMSKYMKEDGLSGLTDTANRLMIDGSGACYQLFSGYTMMGYSIQDSVASSVSDTSLFTLYQYAKENEILYSMSDASDIVDTAIRYNFADLWGAYDGNRKITQQELTELISIATSLPVSHFHFAGREDVVNGTVLMCSETIWCAISDDERDSSYDEFTFIGYPSISGSVHMAEPTCCLAISTTADDQEACWNVLSMLLSEEAQKQTMMGGRIPVTKNMLDTFCECCLHPDQIQDEVLKKHFEKKKAVSQEAVDRFLKDISSADTVQTFDWGVFDIIYDEVNTYYSQSRSPEQIAESLETRLTLYMQENYQ
ncbi:MAG: extracellular solute-binding protein [Clostridiales bacterium]|nr:extracellular solute-binding protein [Clostridiales bacterium]